MNRTDTFLDAMRLVGDAEADRLVQHFFRSGSEHHLYTIIRSGDENFELIADSALRQFLIQKRAAPPWYDNQRLLKGQLFFRKFALDIMTYLGALALPYCYAASPGNKAIHLTGKMRNAPGKRLLETAQFIISVMQPGCFDEQRCGYITINKARLIHAVVRHMILQKSDWNKGWGVPINQEDMAGTNLAFSYIILKGMEQANYAVSAQEKEDFLFAWRFIGYQLHIDDQLLPENYHEAGRLAEKIQHRHFKPSEEGKQLTAELIRHYKKNFAALPAYFIDAQVRYFLGPDIYALLGMKRAPVKDALVRWSNKVKERINPFYTPRSGFEKMLRNHLRLRKKYS